MSFNLTKISAVWLIITCFLTPIFAQNNKLREEKLLNGMKILFANDAAANQVSVKIRLHSGSAFDPQGKEGVMKLLAENIFPTAAARDYFADDLGGSLNITTDYDYIQINAAAKPENVLPMLDTLARAVTAVSIDKDTTAKLKTAQIGKLKESEKNPAYLADQIAARRFFGSFPYGRPILGTAESIAKIDFADLLLAQQRFLTADNATVAVSGNFNSDAVFRAMRRYFGGWEKSDKRVPSTFRQPDEPDAKITTVKAATGGIYEMRFLTRGLARNDAKFAAAEILAQILRERAAAQSNDSGAVTIRSDAHILPGALIFSRRTKTSPAAFDPKTLFAKNIGEVEFNQAKTKVISDFSRRDAIEQRLDADTFRLTSAADEFQNYQNATLADVEAVRVKMAAQPIAAVIVTDSETKN